MLSIYQTYQAYERWGKRGEPDELTAGHIQLKKPIRQTVSWRPGELLVRTGMRLKHPAQAGHALTTSSMAER